MTVTVRDLMTAEVETLPPSASVADLLALMDRLAIRHVPIVEADDSLVGLVSHRDVVRGALGDVGSLPLSNQQQLLARVDVTEVMVEDVATVEADVDIRVAAELMLENKFGCLPVTEGPYLVGILTEADFVKHVLETLAEE